MIIYPAYQNTEARRFPLRAAVIADSYLQNPINRPKGQPFHQLFFCLSGRGRFVIGDRICEHRPGQVCFLPAGIGHEYRAETSDWTVMILGVTGPLAEAMLSAAGLVSPGCYSEMNDEAQTALLGIQELLKEAIDIYEEGAPGMYASLFALCRQVIEAVSGKSIYTDSAVYKEAFPDPVRQVMIYLDEHYVENIRKEDICREVHLSEDYLTALFRKSMGYSIWHHLKLLRFSRAIRLLDEAPLMSIGEVGRASGFTSASYFNRCFKEQTGMTPGQFRKSLQKKDHAVNSLRPPEDSACGAVLRYLEANYAKPVSLADLAELTGLSREYLCVLFKKETGTTVLKCLTDIRLKKAVEIMDADPTLTIAAVGRMCGYDNPGYFGRLLKGQTR